MPISVSALQGLMQPPPELAEHWEWIQAARYEDVPGIELPEGQENAALRVPVGDEHLHIAYRQALALRLASDVALNADASVEAYATC